MPTKRELYHNKEEVNKFFFNKEESEQAREEISQGQGREDWLELKAEVRKVAYEARRQLHQQDDDHEPIGRFLAFFGFK